MEFNVEISKLSESKARIEKAFYRFYDPAMVEQFWTQKLRDSHRREVRSEGRHFFCYALDRNPSFSFALLLAKPSFFEAKGRDLSTWIAAIKTLKSLQHPWVPPLELLTRPGELALVQPFCQGHRPLLAKDLQAWHQLQQNLAIYGLEINDYGQLAEFEGHPFFLDYSDLQPKVSGPA